MNQLDLADIVSESIASQCDVVISHYDAENYDDASAILSEWTMPDNVCILASYVSDNIQQVEGDLHFMTIDDSDIFVGTFTFTPADQLPVDNNWFFHNIIWGQWTWLRTRNLL